ncbi:putative membrane protein [Melghirimyces profundicolus]|uniref:Putative membrane protein n=1 Tax=Melghirimyces profundicolus TaxID=1242148 RepID=A0A2T6BV65_9BACL|nr:cytochrome c oxidase assembly protein [Melghirimyces profundicolus]PTX59975.1 putative membrane protein [Melghirimyces profundicolus]
MNNLLSLFLYPSNWNLPLNLLLLGLAAGYLGVTHPWRRRRPQSTPVRYPIFFLLSLLIYYFALGSPLNLIAHELFSIHMLQMSLLYIVLPPLLLLSFPAWMWRPLVRLSLVQRGLRFLTRPIFSLFLFNGLISLYHVPWIFDRIMASEALHIVSHLALLGSALVMWWPVTCPVPEMNRLSELRKMGYLIANVVLLTPVCALIIFANTPMFELAREPSELFPVLSPYDDQQLGGVIMKIIQEVVYIGAIGYIFFHWVRKERDKDRREADNLPEDSGIEPAPDSL